MITHKCFAQGLLPSSVGTLFTASAATRVTMLTLVNVSGSARTTNIYINKGSTRRLIYRKDYSMAATGSAGDTLVLVGPTGIIDHLALSSGDTIDGLASDASSIEYNIGGGQET